MKRFFSTLKSLVFPPRCGGCRTLLPTAIGKEAPLFCKECEGGWARELSLQCPQCFAAYPDCRCQPTALKNAGSLALVKLAPYGEDTRARVVRAIVLRLKKAPDRRTMDFLAQELESGLLQALAKEGCAVTDALLVHVPRDRAARRRTGTDQAEALARALSRRTGIVHRPLLKRTKRTKIQKTLTAKERMRNLVDAFAASEVPSGTCVILVDDVVTTGATTAVAASRLRAAGAEKLITLAIAVTEKKKGRA